LSICYNNDNNPPNVLAAQRSEVRRLSW